jgi:hypothetical protein
MSGKIRRQANFSGQVFHIWVAVFDYKITALQKHSRCKHAMARVNVIF